MKALRGKDARSSLISSLFSNYWFVSISDILKVVDGNNQ